jgi:hypothetical protein
LIETIVIGHLFRIRSTHLLRADCNDEAPTIGSFTLLPPPLPRRPP